MQQQQRPNQTCLGSLLSYYVVPRRIEDRIDALNHRALEATDPVEVVTIQSQLRSLLREHVRRLRSLMSIHPLRPERRTSKKSHL